MTRAIGILALTAVATAIAVAHPAAQTASLQDDFLKEWTAQKDMLVKIAEAMPAEKYTYKATPAQRDFGGQVMHVAQGHMIWLRTLGAKAPAPTLNGKATSKTETINAMIEAFDYGIAILKEQTDQTMVGTVQGPPWMGPATRARIFAFLMGHAQDIYGQMVVYLRLNGVVPPASQRP